MAKNKGSDKKSKKASGKKDISKRPDIPALDTVMGNIVSSLEDAVASTLEQAKDILGGKLGYFRRQIGDYTKKAAAFNIASHYIERGLTEISEDDEKAIGKKYLPRLQRIVRLNKAKDEVSGYEQLKREKSALEKQKTMLERDLTKLRSDYEAEKQSLDDVRKLERMPYNTLEQAAEDERIYSQMAAAIESKYAKARFDEIIYCIQASHDIVQGLANHIQYLKDIVAKPKPGKK
jgi:hypothetical protein